MASGRCTSPLPANYLVNTITLHCTALHCTLPSSYLLKLVVVKMNLRLCNSNSGIDVYKLKQRSIKYSVKVKYLKLTPRNFPGSAFSGANNHGLWENFMFWSLHVLGTDEIFIFHVSECFGDIIFTVIIILTRRVSGYFSRIALRSRGICFLLKTY